MVFPGQLHGIGQLGGEAMEYENIIFQPTMLMASADEACTSQFLLPLVMEGGQAPVHITQESPGYREFMRCIEVMDHMCGGTALRLPAGGEGGAVRFSVPGVYPLPGGGA